MESIIDILSQGRDREGQASKVYGVVVGIVVDNKDPEKLGRIKVKFPWLSDKVVSWWARLAYPMAGQNRKQTGGKTSGDTHCGYWWIPEVDDEVLIAFEHGDVRFPYVIGSLYNGVDTPAVITSVTDKMTGTLGYCTDSKHAGSDYNGDGNNHLRFIRSRAGHLFIMDDKPGEERITLTDCTGLHRLTIQSKDKNIVITSEDGDIHLIAKKKIYMECETLETLSHKNTEMTAEGEFKTLAHKDMTHTTQMNMTLDAKMNMTEKAGIKREATSGANTIIKGAMVLIN